MTSWLWIFRLKVRLLVRYSPAFTSGRCPPGNGAVGAVGAVGTTPGKPGAIGPTFSAAAERESTGKADESGSPPGQTSKRLFEMITHFCVDKLGGRITLGFGAFRHVARNHRSNNDPLPRFPC